MQEPLRMYVEASGAVIDADFLKTVGWDTPDKVREMLGDTVQLKEIWLKDATTRRQFEIGEKIKKQNTDGSLTSEYLLEPAARCSVMVEKWNGFPEAPSMDAFMNLPIPVGNALDALIRRYMYPQVSENFIKALPQPQQRSEVVNQS